MRIVCDNCGTKYSIPDDRVRNKPFKIRCKKCEYVIVVQGADQQSGGEEPGWYVVINGEQVGPISTREVEEYYYGQQVDLETYIWRDGYADWVPMNQVSEFTHLVEAVASQHDASAAAAAGAAMGGGYDALAGLGEDDGATRQVSLESVYGDAGQPQDDEPEESTRIMSMDAVGQQMGGLDAALGGDSAAAVDSAFAASSNEGAFGGGGGSGFDDFGGGGDPFGTASSSDDDDDADLGSIFGAAQAASASSNDGGGDSLADLGASAAGAGSSAGPRRTGNDLVGARSENSVLFSLSNLQAIGKPSGSEKKDLPTTEGSGLIDIKALAATQAAAPADTRQSFAAGPAATSSGGGDAFDGSVIPVPAMMPMGTRKSNTGLIIGIAAGAVIILGLITLVIVLLVSGGDEQTAPAQAQTTEEDPVETPELGGNAVAGQGQVVAQNSAMGQPGAAGAVPVAGQPGAAGAVAAPGTPGAAGAAPGAATDAAAAAGQTGDAAADGATAEADAAAADETAAAEEKDEEKSSSSRRSSRSDRKSSRDKTEEKKEEPKTEEKKEEPKKEEKKASGGGNQLSKADVNKVIRGSFGKVRTCSRNADAKGKLNIKFGIKGDGRVSGAKVASSDFNGTKVGACVVKVVEGLKFPAHGGDTVSVTYPFHIN